MHGDKVYVSTASILWSQHGGTRPWTRHGARRASKVLSSLHVDVLGHLVPAAWQSKIFDVERNSMLKDQQYAEDELQLFLSHGVHLK
jgi:hypothetical protein